jgi:hypothetical protein
LFWRFTLDPDGAVCPRDEKAATLDKIIDSKPNGRSIDAEQV